MFRFFYMLCFLSFLLDVFRYGEFCSLKMSLSLFLVLDCAAKASNENQVKRLMKYAMPLPCIRCNPVYPIFRVLLGKLANQPRFPQPTSGHVSFPGEPWSWCFPMQLWRSNSWRHLSNEEQQSTSTMYHVLCPRRRIDRMLGGTQVELLERLCPCHCF